MLIRRAHLNTLTSTRSLIFSSRSPFLTEPLSDRLDTDSLFDRTSSEAGAAVVLVGEAGFLVEADTDVVDGVGDEARDGGAVAVPSASPSVRESLEGLVKIPFKASH